MFDSHEIKKQELEKLSQGQTEVIIVAPESTVLPV